MRNSFYLIATQIMLKQEVKNLYLRPKLANQALLFVLQGGPESSQE